MPVSDSDGDPPGATDSDSSGSSLAKSAILAALGVSVAKFEAIMNVASDPEGFIETIIFDSVVEPLAGFVIDAFALVADALLIAAFGADKTPGDLSSIGLLDPGLYLSQLVIGALAPLGDSIIGSIESFNQAIASIGQQAGIFGTVIIPFLWLVEIAAIMAGVWWIIRVLDLPVVNLDAIVSGLLAPVRWVLKGVGLR